MGTIDLFENTKLSLKSALSCGYIITPGDRDGSGVITSPQGNSYTIEGFKCDCPDSALRGGTHKGHCKHAIWLSQLYPCPTCDRHMLLTKVEIAGVEGFRYEYRCANTHVMTWEAVENGR